MKTSKTTRILTLSVLAASMAACSSIPKKDRYRCACDGCAKCANE